ncbi:MAG: dTDP-4-dehydrorhamnose reductase [Legionella sp.]|uniref:dTDP-4-dehydrorhamnose reductase n=1 Tax=Legionella sp. TaxID=459 RepID=UPI0039E6669A
MKLLLIGKDGQVGRELSRSLILLGQVIAVGRAELDLADANAVHTLLKHVQPDVIINAAAYTAVDKAETNPEDAYKVNHEAVAQLGDYAHQHNSILIHYSTDYVFNGTKQDAYVEHDATNPLNIYGASKLAGEQAILKSGCRGYIFRTSWVYALHGTNFIKTILRLAQHKESLNVIHDQRGAPTSAELISDVTLLAIHAALRDQLAAGIYHLTPSGVTTWYDLASYIVSESTKKGITLKLNPAQINSITSEEYSTPAKRPKNSVLSTTKLTSSLGLVLPDWTVHVDRIIHQLIQAGHFNEA